MDILPIDKEVLERVEKEAMEEAEAEQKLSIEIKEVEVKENLENEKENPSTDEIFEKPIEISKKTGKPKRQLSEAQKANLAKARERSAEKRKNLKEVREMEKAEKKLKRELVQEEKLKKREDDDLKIRLAAQMKLDAEKATHWSEDRLTKLMEKTLDNYIDKRKKMKPKPRDTIPYVEKIKPAPQVQRTRHNPQYQPQPYRDPTPHYQQQSAYDNNVMNTLFGNFGND